MSKERQKPLIIKWARSIGDASSIYLEDPEAAHCLIAVPENPAKADQDVWLLVCNSQGLAGRLVSSLQPAAKYHGFMKKYQVISLDVRSGSPPADFNETVLVAKLMEAQFHNIKDTDRPWPPETFSD